MSRVLLNAMFPFISDDWQKGSPRAAIAPLGDKRISSR